MSSAEKIQVTYEVRSAQGAVDILPEINKFSAYRVLKPYLNYTEGKKLMFTLEFKDFDKNIDVKEISEAIGMMLKHYFIRAGTRPSKKCLRVMNTQVYTTLYPYRFGAWIEQDSMSVWRGEDDYFIQNMFCVGMDIEEERLAIESLEYHIRFVLSWWQEALDGWEDPSPKRSLKDTNIKIIEHVD